MDQSRFGVRRGKMNWSKPEVVEVNMSAEIGGYQGDGGDDDDPRFAQPEHGAMSLAAQSDARDPS
jgi:hypothetical protein